MPSEQRRCRQGSQQILTGSVSRSALLIKHSSVSASYCPALSFFSFWTEFIVQSWHLAAHQLTAEVRSSTSFTFCCRCFMLFASSMLPSCGVTGNYMSLIFPPLRRQTSPKILLKMVWYLSHLLNELKMKACVVIFNINKKKSIAQANHRNLNNNAIQSGIWVITSNKTHKYKKLIFKPFKDIQVLVIAGGVDSATIHWTR